MFNIQDSGLSRQSSGFRVWGLGLKVFRVHGSGLRAGGLGCCEDLVRGASGTKAVSELRLGDFHGVWDAVRVRLARCVPVLEAIIQNLCRPGSELSVEDRVWG